MKQYYTSQIAGIIGIHENTVRLYEKLKWIAPAKRLENGYRIFNDLHVEQLKLVRMALKIEMIQNGLRKKAIQIIEISAKKEFEHAISCTSEYQDMICREKKLADQALVNAQNILFMKNVTSDTDTVFLRKEAADALHITVDTLRNWERNGLLTVKRKKNGYRIYTPEDMQRLSIIRALRCANYSLEAILRMISAITNNPDTDIREVINTPREEEDTIYVCDKLLTSLNNIEEISMQMMDQIIIMKKMNINNPPL